MPISHNKRREFTRRVAGKLAQENERSAYAYLRAAKYIDDLPSDWDDNPIAVNRQLVVDALMARDVAITEALAEMFDMPVPTPATARKIPARDVSDFGPPRTKPDISDFGPPPKANAANEFAPISPRSAESAPSAISSDGPIFVVHGHDHGRVHETARLLERATGREVVILHEKPNQGRTIIEKFEHHGAKASYAVVLLTADDEGGAASSTERHPRGRQNVIFELGFFFGKLGRERIAVLLDHGVEQPSDINGIVYIPFDANGAWKSALGKELDAVDIPFDFKRVA